MFEKSPKSYTDLLGKTNRIVEGTTIKGDIISPADFRLDGHLIGNFQTKGKIVIGPAGSVKGDIICKNADILIAAIGRPNFVKADMVKKGAVIVSHWLT